MGWLKLHLILQNFTEKEKVQNFTHALIWYARVADLVPEAVEWVGIILKKTGEKFFKQSYIQFSQITHYKIKSKKSGKTLLLSADWIKRRFTQTPYSVRKKSKNIFNWLQKFR